MSHLNPFKALSKSPWVVNSFDVWGCNHTRVWAHGSHNKRAVWCVYVSVYVRLYGAVEMMLCSLVLMRLWRGQKVILCAQSSEHPPPAQMTDLHGALFSIFCSLCLWLTHWLTHTHRCHVLFFAAACWYVFILQISISKKAEVSQKNIETNTVFSPLPCPAIPHNCFLIQHHNYLCSWFTLKVIIVVSMISCIYSGDLGWAMLSDKWLFPVFWSLRKTAHRYPQLNSASGLVILEY